MRIESQRPLARQIDRLFDAGRSLTGAILTALPGEFFTEEIMPSPRRERSDEEELARLLAEFDGT